MSECAGRVQQRGHFKRLRSSLDPRQERGEAVRERLSQNPLQGGLLFAYSALDVRAFEVRQMRSEQPVVAVDILLMRTQPFQVYVEHDHLRLQAAMARSAERNRQGLPPGGFRGPPSSSHSASRISSIDTGFFRPAGERIEGQDAIADASDAQDARIALFSAVVRAA